VNADAWGISTIGCARRGSRAEVRARRARAMAWTAAERTRRGQPLGRGWGWCGCRAMKVLFKNLEKLSGQAGDNARERLDLSGIGTH
jgi:hypothetical protein